MSDFIEGDDLSRIKLFVNDINDKMLSITNEVNQTVAYKGYLNEKLSKVIEDVKILDSIINEK